MVFFMVLGGLCALAAAGLSGLCLWELRRRETPRPPDEAAEESQGDAELREGFLNLMRYSVGEKKEE